MVPQGGSAVQDDLVGRDFTATAPNAEWLIDFIEHSTAWIPVRRNTSREWWC
jgi:hypothetical protein